MENLVDKEKLDFLWEKYFYVNWKVLVEKK